MKSAISKSLLAGGTLLAGCLCGFANDWVQYRGPNGDGTSSEKPPKTWSSSGPRKLWTAKTPAGFSSFTTGQGKVFTIVAREIDGTLSEVCVALDAETGKEIWAAPTGRAKYRSG